MLLQHHHLDAGAGQQEPSIMPAGPPPAMQQPVVMVSVGIYLPRGLTETCSRMVTDPLSLSVPRKRDSSNHQFAK